MSTDWIDEIQSDTERERRSKLIADLADLWLQEFQPEVDEAVAKLNHKFPEKFNRELRVVPSVGIELRCGPNIVFHACLISGGTLKVTRNNPVGKLSGDWKAVTTHYTGRLDHNENLYFESKSGQPILCKDMNRELFGH